MHFYNNPNYLILVDENDNQKGFAEKLWAHEIGILHRAVSIFIRCKNEILLQKRAAQKYHSAGQWANAACSHPFPGESTEDAAKRALMKELNLELPLEFMGSFIYKETLNNTLVEHELDHVFVGQVNEKPDVIFQPDEVAEILWIDQEELKNWFKESPHEFTAWFPHLTSSLSPALSW